MGFAVIYALRVDELETGLAAVLTAQALSGEEVTVQPRHDARGRIDAALAEPLEGRSAEQLRETWGLTPDAIAEAARVDALYADSTLG